jgi:type IV pilus assembly protein PilB
MARMDIAEHRRPLDGRFSLVHKRQEFNFRVNSLPLSDGQEKLVIRILRPSKSITDFNELGMHPDDIRRIEELYRSPHGIVLICGPTGAGKTTTLYTILNKINDEYRNISTIEDPIELQIEGLNQAQVNTKADFTFASALRSLLRQDPDVIMVGEIRDFDTLESSIHASLTGHLVFSTIHANTTAATVTRLIEMGADGSLLSASLLGIVAQRLVRKICQGCKQPYEASAAEKALIFPDMPEKREQRIILHKAKGCHLCGNTGYNGRVGLFEIMVMDRKIKQLIGNKAMDIEIEDAAVANGMKTLFASSRQVLLEGQTSLQELVRVMGLHLGRNI